MASAVGYDRSAFGFWLWQQCLWLFAIASVVIGLFTLVQWFVAIIAGALGFQPLAMAATLVVRYMGPGALTVAVVVSEQQLEFLAMVVVLSAFSCSICGLSFYSSCCGDCSLVLVVETLALLL